MDILEKRSVVPGIGRIPDDLRNHGFVVNQRLILIFIVIILLMGIPVVDGSTRCVNVTSATGCDYTYPTINLALAAASNYDTIKVGPGLYNERLTIKKPITLTGATAGVTKKGYLVPSDYVYDNEVESVISPQDMSSVHVIVINSNNVTLDGFIISSTTAGSFTPYAPTDLIRMDTSPLNNVTIQNNVLGPNTNLTIQNGSAGRMGITISKWSGATSTDTIYNLQIRNNKIFDAKGDGCGILIIGARNDTLNPPKYQFKGAVIDNNEITGNHRSGIDFSAGVQGSPDNHIKITNNFITNNGWNHTVDRDNIKWGNGITLMRMTNQINDLLPWGPRYIDIENNIISGNEKNGIYAGPVTKDIVIKNNIIQNNGAGSSVDNQKSGYNNNWDGIQFDLDEVYQINEQIRTGGTYSGLKLYNHLTNITITENSISGNGGQGLNVTQTPLKGLIDARRNYWGSSSGPRNTIINPSGTGERVSSFVRLSPWYTNSEKTTTQSSAFEDSGIFPVSQVSPGNYTTIQAAINAASSGDTIKVYPGTYDERIVINRSITLLGATSGVSKKDYNVPKNYAYDDTKESIISPSSVADLPVVQIRNSSVTFKGFIVKFIHSTEYPELYPVTDLISINNQDNEYSDVRIENNVVGPNTNLLSQNGKQGRMGIVVPGARTKYVHSLTIANNKIFNATGDGCGIMLLGSQNTSSSQGLAAVYQDSLIDNNTISGNHRSGIELSGGVQGGATLSGHLRITSNNITDNGWNSTVDRNNVTFGNGMVMIHIRSDKENEWAWGSRYVDIDNNIFRNNEKNAIYIGPINRDITITNNIISDNGIGKGGYSIWDGVRIDLDEEYHTPTYKNYGFLKNIILKGNDIINNGDYGVRVIQTPTLGSIDARNNWWGNASGPRDVSKSSTLIASNVSDNVLFSPWYTSPAKSGASTLPKPMATFTVDKVEDTVPAKFSFDASASESQSKSTITSYQWDYGDGNKSAASKNPLSSWTYEVAKVQTITLTVKDSNGMTNTSTRQVTVIAKKELIPITFNGTTISGTTGKQEITFVSANLNGTMTNTTNTVTIVDPGNGWDQMIVKGNTSGTAGTTVTVQNITEVVLSSKPVVTQLDTTATGPGEVTTSIQLSLKELANAPLQVEVTQGANDTVSNAFQLAAGSDNKVDAVAYTMIIKGSSLINSNLSASTEPVVLNMSVSESWVNSNGGIGAMKVIRFSDDGATKEVLDTQYLFTAGAPAMCYFKVISPNGCSIFGVASVSAVPRTSSGGGSASGSSSSSSRHYYSSESGRLQEQRAPLQPAEGEAALTDADKSQLPAPTLAAPLEAGGDAGEIPLAGAAEREISRSLGTVVAFIAENIVALCAGAAAIVGCVSVVRWYRQRQQYWR